MKSLLFFLVSFCPLTSFCQIENGNNDESLLKIFNQRDSSFAYLIRVEKKTSTKDSGYILINHSDGNENFELDISKDYITYYFPLDSLQQIDINELAVKSLNITELKDHFTFQSTQSSADIFSFSSILNHLDGATHLNINLLSSKADAVILRNSSTSELYAVDSRINTLQFRNTKISSIILDSLTRPNRLILDNVTFLPENIPFNLTIENFKKGTKLVLRNTEVSLLKFDYTFYELDIEYLKVEYGFDVSQITSLYHDILEMQKKYGFSRGQEKADIELRSFVYESEGNYLANFIQKYFWGYGYDKYLLLKYILIVWILFTTINFMWRNQLLYQTYIIEEFREVDSEWNRKKIVGVKGFLLRFMNMFVYTGFLFWGIRLNLDRLKLRPYGLAVFVVLQYCTGLFFLAIVINKIISA